MTLFMRTALALLQRMKNPALLPMGLQYVERFLPPGDKGLELLMDCTAAPSWVTRYLASKNLGGHYTQSPDRVWDVLMRLTHDPERFVREGVPLSLAVIAANDSTPEIEDKVLALARSEDAHVRRASAYTALVLWRQGQCGELRTAMLKQVARKRDDGIGRLVGRRIVAEEIAKIDEHGAMALVEEWAESADPVLHWQAQQALQGSLETAFPQRVERVREQLALAQEVPQAVPGIPAQGIEERA